MQDETVMLDNNPHDVPVGTVVNGVPRSLVVTSPTVTTTTVETIAKESTLLNVSIRAWIALLVVGTICYMSIAIIEVKEPLYTLGGLIVGFFFGQAKSPKNQQ